MGYIEKIRKLVGSEPIILNSAGVILTDNHGDILLCYRKDTENWGLPGGYMELGETVDETVLRELREEMDISVKNQQLFKIFSGSDFYHEYPNGDKVYSVMAVFTASEYDGTLTADNMEIEATKFFSVDSLPERLTNNTRKVLEVYKNSNMGGDVRTCTH